MLTSADVVSLVPFTYPKKASAKNKEYDRFGGNSRVIKSVLDDCAQHRFSHAVQTHLLHNAPAISFDNVQTQVQAIGDMFVAVTFGVH